MVFAVSPRIVSRASWNSRAEKAVLANWPKVGGAPAASGVMPIAGSSSLTWSAQGTPGTGSRTGRHRTMISSSRVASVDNGVTASLRNTGSLAVVSKR